MYGINSSDDFQWVEPTPGAQKEHAWLEGKKKEVKCECLLTYLRQKWSDNAYDHVANQGTSTSGTSSGTQEVSFK